MKKSIIIAFLFIGQFYFAQATRDELAESKLYIKASYKDQQNEIISLQLRTELKDTLIDNRPFKKYKMEEFVDYKHIDNTEIYYESFQKENYQLLDQSFDLIHNIDYLEVKEQMATLFKKTIRTSLEFVDTRSSFPRDSLIPTNKTPRKFYQRDNPEIYVTFLPDLKLMAISSNGEFYNKNLIGDNYNDISEGIQNNFKTNNRFEIEAGDEIQLLYRRKWYNDSTGIAEYEDKQYKNFKYLKDTLLNSKTSLKLIYEGFNYLSGTIEEPKEFFIQVSDDGYFYSNQFIPFKDYSTELKLTYQNGEKDIFMQGVSKDTLNGFNYEKIVQATSGPYRYFILPFFPMQYYEFGNVQGKITYSKIMGVEKGMKREPTFITDSNNIRRIISVSNQEVNLEIYFIDIYDLRVELKDNNSDEVMGLLTSKSTKGLNILKLNTEKLEKGRYYHIQINYQGENGSGSFSNGLISNY